MVKVKRKKKNPYDALATYGCLLIIIILLCTIFVALIPSSSDNDKNDATRTLSKIKRKINKHYKSSSFHAQKEKILPKKSSLSHELKSLTAPEILQNKYSYLVYGTAWKAEQTSELVQEAIEAGFRFIDTANQLKHYHEAGVGEGWTKAAKKLNLSREDFYLQTKFTSIQGQDDRLPYDKDASLEDQVRQSLESSLQHLQTSFIDALVMHSPLPSMEKTMRVWRVFESFVDENKVKKIGMSNMYDFNKFKSLYEEARIKPSVLQNRFYSDSNFDTQLRSFCKAHDVTYQSFWTLTANIRALKKAEIHHMAEQKHLTPQTLMYAFMMTLGHTPLDGSTNMHHMKEDITVMERMHKGEVILNEDEMKEMAHIIGVEYPIPTLTS